MMLKLVVVLVLFMSIAVVPDQPPGGQRALVLSGPGAGRITSTRGLLRSMQRRYSKRLYRNFTCSQTVTFYRRDGGVLRTFTGYVSRKRPGFQRIDIVPLKDRKATVYRDDSVVEFQYAKRV